jgi:flagellar biosynthetic protein FliO
MNSLAQWFELSFPFRESQHLPEGGTLNRLKLKLYGFIICSAFALCGPLAIGARGETAAATPPPAVQTAPQDQSPARDLTPVFTSGPEELHSEEPVPLVSLARALGALLVVLGLVGVTAWILKRYGPVRSSVTSQINFGILSSAALGEKRTLSVIRFGNQALLIGSTPTSMTLLAQMALSELEPQPQATDSNASAPIFARQLSQVYAELEASEQKSKERFSIPHLVGSRKK